jgi:hypothetical protein
VGRSVSYIYIFYPAFSCGDGSGSSEEARFIFLVDGAFFAFFCMAGALILLFHSPPSLSSPSSLSLSSFSYSS